MQAPTSVAERGCTKLPAPFWLGVCAILGIAGTLQFTSALQESPTADEATHLAAGYSYWKTGDFRLNVAHPPLSNLLASIPLLWLKPELRTSLASWQNPDEFQFGKIFLYENTTSADAMLTAARAVTMVLNLLLTLGLAWWVGRIAGSLAGIIAAVLFAFEPTVLAHSRYVTSDIPVTVFIWLSCISWCAYLEKPSRHRLVGTGILTGLAVATKFNALFLYVVFGLLWLVRRRLPGSIPVRARRAFAVLLVLSAFVVLGSYFFQTLAVADDPGVQGRIEKLYQDDGSIRSRVVQSALHLPVPGYYFLRGALMIMRFNQSGHSSYLLGRVRTGGSWLYFPVAILVKSPVAWLALAVAALGLFLWRIMAGAYERDTVWRLVSLILPAAVYLAASMAGSINIGIRHLLPMYPFVCAFVAILLFGRLHRAFWVRTFATAGVLFFLVESATAFPRYLSFFNVAVGGPANGTTFLLDSNIDWGQDLKRLKTWTQSRDVQPLCIGYFGVADPAYYSIDYRPLAPVRTADDRASLNCVAAVSVQLLFGEPDDPYAALRDLVPTDRVGDSILVYDLRHTRQE